MATESENVDIVLEFSSKVKEKVLLLQVLSKQILWTDLKIHPLYVQFWTIPYTEALAYLGRSSGEGGGLRTGGS